MNPALSKSAPIPGLECISRERGTDRDGHSAFLKHDEKGVNVPHLRLDWQRHTL